MDFLLYEPEDFASDESYLRYYFRLKETDIKFWQQWISQHPEKLDCIINADQLISFLSLHLDETEIVHEYQRLMLAIQDNNHNPETAAPVTITGSIDVKNTLYTVPRPSHQDNSIKKIQLFQKALTAVIIAAVIVSICMVISPFRKGPAQADDSHTKGNIHLWKKTNHGIAAIQFQLEDGSIITLKPGSELTYPPHFLPAKREVFLEGEAFFEISKNKSRPFYVYCKNLVTHVLGTSFNIKSDNIHGKIEVDVRTGKVEVYQKYKDATANAARQSNGLILTPNQKAVYLEENKTFESTLVDIPLPIAYTSEQNVKDTLLLRDLHSKSALMSDILKSLETTYGIEIETENENIKNCHFRGDMADMNLYFKLDAICQSLNMTYEVKGTKILLRGKGCN
jgi:transmembrane sensor